MRSAIDPLVQLRRKLCNGLRLDLADIFAADTKASTNLVKGLISESRFDDTAFKWDED